jgi:hypothetical protein
MILTQHNYRNILPEALHPHLGNQNSPEWGIDVTRTAAAINAG